MAIYEVKDGRMTLNGRPITGTGRPGDWKLAGMEKGARNEDKPFAYEIEFDADGAPILRLTLNGAVVEAAGSFRDQLLAMMDECLREYEQIAARLDIEEGNHE